MYVTGHLYRGDISVTGHSTWMIYVRYMSLYVDIICPFQSFYMEVRFPVQLILRGDDASVISHDIWR